MHNDPEVSPSGTFKKIALAVVEIKRMSPIELATHVLSLGQSPQALLSCVFDYLSDKPDVLYGMLKHMGLLKDALPPVLKSDPAAPVEHSEESPPPEG